MDVGDTILGHNEKYSEMRKKPMEYRKVFDTIPEQFDKFRPRYSPELFEFFIKEANIGVQTKVLEIGPGTGRATIQWIPEKVAFSTD